MSDKVATGKSQAVTEKSAGWVEFEIDVGTQYPVKLATKQDEIIELGRAAHRGGEPMDWLYTEKESDKINERSGKPFINRYLNGVEPVDAARSVATPAAAQTGSSDTMSKDEWGRKDSAIHRMAATKAAADALKHTVPSDPSDEDIRKFVERVKTVSYQWWQQADAVRKGDDSDLPFLSEHDQEIPY